MSVVHPLHPSSSPAEVTPGTAAARREKVKLNSEAATECRKHQWKFTPVAVETTGCWGPEARRCIRELSRRQCSRSGEELGDVAKRLWRRMSSVVAKGVAQMLLRGHSAGLHANAAVPDGLAAE